MLQWTFGGDKVSCGEGLEANHGGMLWAAPHDDATCATQCSTSARNMCQRQ
jgi:hypothetical protein